MKAATITLYVRTACPLCEEAEATLRTLVAEEGGDAIRVVDIEADAALHQRLVAEIPAIEIGGRLLANASGRLRIAAFLAAAVESGEGATDHAVTT
jgi:glutaredoxin